MRPLPLPHTDLINVRNLCREGQLSNYVAVRTPPGFSVSYDATTRFNRYLSPIVKITTFTLNIDGNGFALNKFASMRKICINQNASTIYVFFFSFFFFYPPSFFYLPPFSAPSPILFIPPPFFPSLPLLLPLFFSSCPFLVPLSIPFLIPARFLSFTFSPSHYNALSSFSSIMCIPLLAWIVTFTR